LYPNPERHLDASKVAKLVALTNAPVSAALLKSVDGKDVTDQGAQAFDLLPGCHVVQTAKNLMIASDYVVWRGAIGSRTFALRIKPGRKPGARGSLTLKAFGTDNPPHPPLALRARPSRTRKSPTQAARR
jgi:hypothetical protein